MTFNQDVAALVSIKCIVHSKKLMKYCFMMSATSAMALFVCPTSVIHVNEEESIIML